MATRPGKIYTFQNRPDVAKAELLIDIGKTTYGVAFHPRYAENRYFYVTYVLDAKKSEQKGSRLSQFEASQADPPVGDPERSLIYQRMKMEGLGRMPHVASVVDQEALTMLRAWILELGDGDQIQRRGAVNPRVAEGD